MRNEKLGCSETRYQQKTKSQVTTKLILKHYDQNTIGRSKVAASNNLTVFRDTYNTVVNNYEHWTKILGDFPSKGISQSRRSPKPGKLQFLVLSKRVNYLLTVIYLC